MRQPHFHHRRPPNSEITTTMNPSPPWSLSGVNVTLPNNWDNHANLTSNALPRRGTRFVTMACVNVERRVMFQVWMEENAWKSQVEWINIAMKMVNVHEVWASYQGATRRRKNVNVRIFFQSFITTRNAISIANWVHPVYRMRNVKLVETLLRNVFMEDVDAPMERNPLQIIPASIRQVDPVR